MSVPISPQKCMWLDGKIVPWGDAKLHIISHALHYGTGVFEGIKAFKTDKGTSIFRLQEHIKRFFDSAKILRINIPFSPSEISNACKSVLLENNLEEAYIRPIAFKDCMAMGLNAMKCPSRVAIAAWPWSTYLGQAYTHGARCMISSWRRTPTFSFPGTAKVCGCYVNSQLAKMEAVENGYDEGIMLDVRGYVSEGSGENIFAVIRGKLVTPSASSSILLGITRDTLMVLAKDLGYDVREEDITVGEMLTAEEVFLAGTAADVTPVVEISNYKIGDGKPGKITVQLQDLYEKVKRGKSSKYNDWLTYIGK